MEFKYNKYIPIKSYFDFSDDCLSIEVECLRTLAAREQYSVHLVNRAVNALRRRGINTMRELLELSIWDMQSFRNLGSGCQNQLFVLLQRAAEDPELLKPAEKQPEHNHQKEERDIAQKTMGGYFTRNFAGSTEHRDELKAERIESIKDRLRNMGMITD